MSRELDHELNTYDDYLSQLLTLAIQVADATRVLGIEEPTFRGGEIARHPTNGMVMAAQELKHGYFLALSHYEADNFNPDPFTRYGLKGCLAWILKYDSHHAKWSVEASNNNISDRSFSRLARSLKTFPRPGSVFFVVT